jgi:hypothetical protein
LFGVERQRDGIAFAAVKNGGDFAGFAEALGLVLASVCARGAFYYDLILSHAFFLP